MDFWRDNVHRILTSNDFTVLDHKGSVSHQQMEDHAREAYLQFDTRRKQFDAEQAEQQDRAELKELEDTTETLKQRKSMEPRNVE